MHLNIIYVNFVLRNMEFEEAKKNWLEKKMRKAPNRLRFD